MRVWRSTTVPKTAVWRRLVDTERLQRALKGCSHENVKSMIKKPFLSAQASTS